MFENIGDKIKTLAKICCLIGIIGSVITGIILISSINVLVGIAITIGGALLSWIGSFFVYGFGELIESNAEISTQNSEIIDLLKKQQDKPESKQNNTAQNASLSAPKTEKQTDFSNAESVKTQSINSMQIKCPRCGTVQPSSFTECVRCNSKFE